MAIPTCKPEDPMRCSQSLHSMSLHANHHVHTACMSWPFPRYTSLSSLFQLSSLGQQLPLWICILSSTLVSQSLVEPLGATIMQINLIFPCVGEWVIYNTQYIQYFLLGGRSERCPALGMESLWKLSVPEGVHWTSSWETCLPHRQDLPCYRDFHCVRGVKLSTIVFNLKL